MASPGDAGGRSALAIGRPSDRRGGASSPQASATARSRRAARAGAALVGGILFAAGFLVASRAGGAASVAARDDAPLPAALPRPLAAGAVPPRRQAAVGSNGAGAASGADGPLAETSAKSCDALLKPPKVALLFLTRGPMPHEPTWAAWLAGAAGLVPLPTVAAKRDGCGPEAVAALEAACGPAAGRRAAHKFGEDRVDGSDAHSGSAAHPTKHTGAAILRSQHLFSVYVHAPPDFPDYPPDSLFAGRLVAHRVSPAWGTHDLVDATRSLYRAALADPLTQRFVMLSESGVPVLPPATVYAALMGSDKSRVNACPDDRTDPWRWHPDMEPAGAAPGASIPFDKWRKSSQWSVLTRAHAAAVADDTAIDTIFRNVCYSRDWDAALERQYVCFSDEHYIPTLLALKGWDNQTDCLGYTVAVDWSQGGAHPKTYGAADITADTLASIRDSWGQCAAVAANAAAAALVVPPSSVTPAACATVAHAAGVSAANPMAAVWASRLTPRECSLFARKFPADTAAPLTAVLRDCRVNAIQPCVAPDLPRDGEDEVKAVKEGGGD